MSYVRNAWFSLQASGLWQFAALTADETPVAPPEEPDAGANWTRVPRDAEVWIRLPRQEQ